MANKEIHDLITSEQLSSSDVVAEQRDGGGGTWLTRKFTLDALGLFLNKILNYASDLHTTSKTIIGAINELQSSGGAGALNDLSDVSISSPTEGQIFIYDSANQLWKNADASYSFMPAVININKGYDQAFFDITITSGGVNVYQATVQTDSIWGNFSEITDTFIDDGIVNNISMYGDGIVGSDTVQNWLHITLNGTTYNIGNTVRNPTFDLNVNVDASVKGAGLKLPSAPSTDGTYTLQLMVASGVPTLTWIPVS